MTNILVIGSEGFIGKNVIEFFDKTQKFNMFSCDIVDNNYNNVNYFQIDSNNAEYDFIFKDNKIDFCINCSGASDVSFSFSDPIYDFRLNVYNVIKVLNSIKNYSPSCKFIQLSSAAVYGNPERLPISEGDSINPLSPYAFHKLQSEKVCEEYFNFFNINTCIIRIFSAYGKGLKKQLFWDLWQKIKTNNELSLHGTGNESRDFIHVNDVAQAILLIIEKGEFNSTIYNVANGEEVYIKKSVELFCDIVKWKGTFNYNNQNKIGYPKNWCADISKIKSLGFKKSIDFQEGLTDYFKWVQELN